ncbi:MAG: family 16 glycoside hydrolase [Verrucomicrobiales bacterium]
MMRLLTCVLILITGAGGAAAQTLFDGKSLEGWDGNPEFWRVENGVIVGETTADKPTKGNTFLIWEGGDVGDFTLRLKARIMGNNSGIQYRSKVFDPEKWAVGGYQMDMHPSPDYLGMLYEERGRGITAQRGEQVMLGKDGERHVVGMLDKGDKIDLAQWNDYQITARGNRIEHSVNGKLTARIIDNDPAKRSTSGVLALQLHAGEPMRAEFKDIRLHARHRKPGANVTAIATSKGERVQKLKPAAPPEWIWRSKPAKSETAYFRRQWTQSARPKAAKLTITCDNSFTAYINGKKIGGGSAWENRYEFDLKKHLRNGDNVLAVEATNEGSTGGLVARIDLTDARGIGRTIKTDKEWHVTDKKSDGWMAPSADTSSWARPVVIGKMGDSPWGDVFSGKRPRKKESAAAAPRVPEGFAIEKLYDVPKGEQGSWVSMAVDDKGRLYCGDQGKQGIFRITLGDGDPLVEKVPADISGAQGMQWAFGSLYVCLNGGKPGSGLYRLSDSNGDDKLDKVETLRRFDGGGEHGPHAVVLAPDGESLFVIGGNHTRPPKPESSAVVPNYDEDQLLPRMPDARGHAASIRAPGGWIARTDKDGKSFELFSAGFRNQYDVAFNADGEMFTYDSDMEWDIGTPWYRPTRIYHVTSGSDFGWRTGTGKFPAWYPDVLPPALDVGPGSPTGVVSGLGAKFPVKYQAAIYAFDWTYGTIYAMHLTPAGGTYRATKEEFVVGVPLNVTDGVIGKDGNFYFAVGGRGTPSALYRVKYVGSDKTDWQPRGNKLAYAMRMLRHEMEKLHERQDSPVIDKIWPNLGHQDRSVRYAARVALEHQPLDQWVERALAERDPQTALSALLALARQGSEELQEPLLGAMAELPFTGMDEAQRLELLRVLGLCIIRMGQPSTELASDIVARLSPYYPAPSDALNRELVALLVTLGDPAVVAKTISLMGQEATAAEGLVLSEEFLKRSGYGGAFAATQESNPQRQQIWYAYALKNATSGWTPALRKEFFTWFAKSRNFKGGNSFGGFLENFRKEALAKIPDEKLRAEMDELSKQTVALIPAGFENARKIKVGTKPVMKFDIERLEAKAGEKVAIVFANNDPTGIMHNLAVCTPGSREKVVAAALTIGAKAIEQNFVPDLPEVLGSTPQIAPGRQYTLYMTIPSQPGDYDYVCTYPGHGQLMHGILKVTE